MEGTQPPKSGRQRFGEWEIELDGERLLRSGREVPLRPKAFALLAHLVRHPGQLVTGEQLLAAVWPEVKVSDATLASTLRTVRDTLADGDDPTPLIRTVRGRGYRFEGELEYLVPPALGGGAAAGDAAWTAHSEASFIGRGDVLSAGRASIRGARQGRMRILVLAGEAGIGKSRCLHELAVLAAQEGLEVHAGRCLEEEGAPACWPWRQILRGILDGLPETERDAFAQRHASAFALLPELAPPAAPSTRGSDPSDGAATRFQVFDAIAQLLAMLARSRPLAIVLDDLHRADVPSAQLLRHLAAALEGAPVVIFATLRPGELPDDHPLTSFLAELHVAGSRLDITGLAVDETGQLVESLWQRAPLREIAEAIQARSEGNPLFATEIARALERDEARDSPEAAAAAAPAGIHELLRLRVSRLPAATIRLLERASVLGREFTIDALRLMSGDEPEGSVEAAIETARLHGFLAEAPKGSGRLRFVHILMRDAIYGDLALERRSELHRDAGHALESLHPLELEAHAEELSHHYSRALTAGEAERAQRYARMAGELAHQLAAYDEACRHFDAALHALGRRPGLAHGEELADWAKHERIELQLLRGRATWLGGDSDTARTIYTEAAEEAEEANLPELLARAALGMAGRTDATPGVNRAAVALMERALDRLSQDDDPLRAELMARLGTELYYDADTSRSQDLTRESVAIAERSGDPSALAYSLSARHYAMLRPDVHPRRRLPLVDSLLEISSALGDREVLAFGLQEMLLDLLELGDRGRFEEALRRYSAMGRELRHPFFTWMASAWKGMSALLDGDVARADQIAQQTLELGQQCGSPNALPLFAAQLFHLRIEQGRLAELEPLMGSVLDAQEVYATFHAVLAAVQTAAGKRREARAILADLDDRLDDVPRDKDWLILLGILTSPALAARDEALIARIHAYLEPYAGRLIAGGHGTCCHGAVDHHLGRPTAGLGDHDAAQEHFEAAEVLHRRLQARLWLAHTQREHAHVMWKSGALHERERARGLTDDAVAGYSRLGLDGWVAEAKAGLR